MTSSKAVYGGIAGALTTIATYFVSLIPGYSTLPERVDASIELLVAAAIVTVVVWLAPANGPVKEVTSGE
jgi:hypothetical protein